MIKRHPWFLYKRGRKRCWIFKKTLRVKNINAFVTELSFLQIYGSVILDKSIGLQKYEGNNPEIRFILKKTSTKVYRWTGIKYLTAVRIDISCRTILFLFSQNFRRFLWNDLNFTFLWVILFSFTKSCLHDFLPSFFRYTFFTVTSKESLIRSQS